MTTNSSPLSLSRVSKASLFCGMWASCLLDAQQKINHLLVLSKSLFRCHFERALNKRHVDSSRMGSPPCRAGIRRHYILAVDLSQCLFVNHSKNYLACLL